MLLILCKPYFLLCELCKAFIRSQKVVNVVCKNTQESWTKNELTTWRGAVGDEEMIIFKALVCQNVVSLAMVARVSIRCWLLSSGSPEINVLGLAHDL